MSVKKKEKIVYYADKQGISVRGSEWTLWIQKVKTKDSGEIMFAVKPLETKYDQEKREFHYEPLKAVIWLKKEEFAKFIDELKKLVEG